MHVRSCMGCVRTIETQSRINIGWIRVEPSLTMVSVVKRFLHGSIGSILFFGFQNLQFFLQKIHRKNSSDFENSTEKTVVEKTVENFKSKTVEKSMIGRCVGVHHISRRAPGLLHTSKNLQKRFQIKYRRNESDSELRWEVWFQGVRNPSTCHGCDGEVPCTQCSRTLRTRDFERVCVDLSKFKPVFEFV